MGFHFKTLISRCTCER